MTNSVTGNVIIKKKLDSDQQHVKNREDWENILKQ